MDNTLSLNRIVWIDNAKAIGIFLVMLAHTKGITDELNKFIFSFHMPLFFFLSGYLIKSKYLSYDFKSYLFLYIKKLIIPYAFFWFISYSYWILVKTFTYKSIEFKNVSLFDPIFGLFYGIGPSLYVNTVLWFFTALFMTSIFFYFIMKMRKEFIYILLVVIPICTMFFYSTFHVRLPWNMDIAGVSLPFFVIGYILSNQNVLYKNFKSNKILFVLIIMFLLTAFISIINIKIDMNVMHFGNILLFYLGASFGIIFIMSLSLLIPKNSFSTFFSKNTITLFSLHGLIFSVFTGVSIMFFGLEKDFDDMFIFSLLYIGCACVIVIPIIIFIKKYIPWVIGEKHV